MHAQTVITYPDNPAAALEAAFAKVYRERMIEVPLVNRKLAVASVGFQRWEQYWVGVLVTPWFINLMLLPVDADAWPRVQLGENFELQAPSGSYKFVGGFEEQIGEYLFCSLLSPVNDFTDQSAALAVAADIIRLFMLPPEHRELELQDEAVPGKGVSRRQKQAQVSGSRRNFIRGNFGSKVG